MSRWSYPKAILIAAAEYRIVQEEGLEALGEFSIDGETIKIRKGLSDRTRGLTLLHEIIHAISDTLGANLTEEEVRAMEQGFAMFMRDNPTVIQKIIDDIGE